MIREIHIKNVGIIDDVTIKLEKGFNAITGETGSGKSLIIDSINIISGGRFNKEMIRTGTNNSFVEAIVDIEHEGEKSVIISREIYSNGKNCCKINGRFVTVKELKIFMKNVINIHGQYDNQSLMDPCDHIKFIDEFGGKTLFSALEKYRELFFEYSKIKLKLNENSYSQVDVQRKLDLLNYQLNEISEASLNLNEDEELELKKKEMQNYERINKELYSLDKVLSETVIQGFESAIKSLQKIGDFNTKYNADLDALKNSYYEILDINQNASDYLSELNFDDSSYNKIVDRLDTIYGLKRKYGNSIDEILKYRDRLQIEITDLENLDSNNEILLKQLNELEENMYAICLDITKMRLKVANELELKVSRELYDLEMKNASLKVKVDDIDRGAYTINGLNKVEIFILTNIGDEYKPLSKIASGGEISRIMLALKVVLTNIDMVPIIIFDEIDTGISGTAAAAVAQKIKTLASKHQIIAITHSPILAASADSHYKVKKAVIERNTKIFVELLQEEDVINEIAWITTGKITKAAIEHARELKKLDYTIVDKEAC